MSNAVTSSVALTELKTDLTKLSATLHEIFDLMNADMSQVGQAWQDGKYEEFVQGYRPQINKCEEISARYSEWCSRVLEPTIQNVIAVEKTDVGSGSGGGSVGGVGAASAGVMAGAGATSAAAVSRTIGGGFNLDGNQKPINNSPQQKYAKQGGYSRIKTEDEPKMTQIESRKGSNNNSPFNDFYIKDADCEPGYRRVLKPYSVEKETIDQYSIEEKNEGAQNHYSAGLKATGGIEKSTNPLNDKVSASGSISGGFSRDGEKDTSTLIHTIGTKRKSVYECEPIENDNYFEKDN